MCKSHNMSQILQEGILKKKKLAINKWFRPKLSATTVPEFHMPHMCSLTFKPLSPPWQNFLHINTSGRRITTNVVAKPSTTESRFWSPEKPKSTGGCPSSVEHGACGASWMSEQHDMWNMWRSMIHLDTGTLVI